MRSQANARSGHPQLSGRRVLLVEDDWFIADALANLLDGEGVEVVGPAATLEDAHRLAETRAFDLAVVDLNLGGVRADPIVERLTHISVPVIVVSAYETHEFVSKVFATLQKPVAVSDLIMVLASAAQRPQPTDQPK